MYSRGQQSEGSMSSSSLTDTLRPVLGQAVTSDASHSSKPPFLVVEDDPFILAIMNYVLVEERTYTMIQATSAQQALTTASTMSTRPRMLILDYMLGPGMTGIELYDTLCQQQGWSDIPTVVMSAALPEQEVVKRNLVGIHKPFDLDELLTLIDTTLEKARSPVSDTPPNG